MNDILFLCTGNSCRSQMAEALTNVIRKDDFEAYSAGISPKGVDPRAVKVMSEAGIDISGQKSKDIDFQGHFQENSLRMEFIPPPRETILNVECFFAEKSCG